MSTINTFKSRKDADKALFITIWILSSYFYGRTQEDNGIAKWSFSQGKVLATRTFRTILQHKLFWNITGFWFHLSKIGFFFFRIINKLQSHWLKILHSNSKCAVSVHFEWYHYCALKVSSVVERIETIFLTENVNLTKQHNFPHTLTLWCIAQQRDNASTHNTVTWIQVLGNAR